MDAKVMTPIPNEHPLKKAWGTYKQTEDYSNSLYSAMRLMPFIQAGTPDSDRRQIECELMPIKQRQQNLEGALWAAFMEGWTAAGNHKKEQA